MLKYNFLTVVFAVFTLNGFAQRSLCYAYTYSAENQVTREHFVNNIGITLDIFHVYDQRGREIESKQVDSASGQINLWILTTYYDRPSVYDKKIITVFYYSPDRPDTSIRYQTLNSAGRVLVDSLVHKGPLARTVFTYNDTLLESSVMYTIGKSPQEIDRVEYTYNSKGQLISKKHTPLAGYSIVDYTYNKKGKLVTEKRKKADKSGKVEDLGVIAEYTYSKTGLLLSKKESGKQSDTYQLPSITTYVYDTSGHMTSQCTVYSWE